MAHTLGPWWYDNRSECVGSPAGWVASLAYHGERKGDVDFGDKDDDGALLATALELLASAQTLINNLPDCALELARDSWGNSNTAAVYAGRKALQEIVAKAKGE